MEAGLFGVERGIERPWQGFRPTSPAAFVLPWIGALAMAAALGCGGESPMGDDADVNNNGNSNASSLCGNGIMEGFEECDDGAANSDFDPDACRADCLLASCGDGGVDTGELCDDGYENSDEIPNVCRTDCTPPRCGDQVTDPAVGETCDDGNSEPGDGCNPDCVVEFCGNGVLDPGETCDDGNFHSGDGCSADCLSDESCGNGYLDAVVGETCDGSSLPSAVCGATCQVIYCGNGIVDGDEVCDDGNFLPGDGCSPDCQSTEICGNGYPDFAAGEQCDDGNFRSHDGCSSGCSLEQPNWSQAQLFPMPGRSRHAMAYDAARDRMVVYGGQTDSAYYIDEHWELVGSSWQRILLPNAPPGLDRAALVYDSARGKLVLFGGNTGSGTTNDTWEFDGTSWTQRFPATSPSDRNGHAMVYDAGRGKVVLFGGYSNMDDTWEYDGINWVQRTSGASPPGGWNLAMAYDAARAVVVLFHDGGETWEWDGNNWTQRTPVTSPPGRAGAGMAYDAHRGVIVLFGGGWGGSLDDTWEWDGNNWTELLPATVPPGRYEFGLAYDAARQRIVLQGGNGAGPDELQDQWEFDGVNWTRRFPPPSPSERTEHAMAYDSARSKVVLFGGKTDNTPTADTWEYDGSAWKLRTPSSAPSARYGHAMAFDRSRNRVVLFGGRRSGPLGLTGDTWEYDGTDWVERYPNTSPEARQHHALVYDAARGRVVLFGGDDGTWPGTRNDTWEYDGTDWVERLSLAAPAGRFEHAMAYDTDRQTTILMGGTDDWTELGDTWQFDGTGWTQLLPVTTPPARRLHSMAFLESRGFAVLFGGRVNSVGDLGDTWHYGYGSIWPDEVCAGGVDNDNDGLPGCADPDCALSAVCVACGDGTCSGTEWCGTCPQDCGSCAGCAVDDLRLSEVYGGSPTYLELTNQGSCVVDAGGVTLLFRLGCDAAVRAFTLPPGSILSPGSSFRVVSLFDSTMSNEVHTGANLCDSVTGQGWVMLCDGPCDLSGCTNVVDYFEKQGGSAPVSPPACASFSPAPVDVSGATAGDSATRSAFNGGGAAGLQADWSVAPMSRN